MAKPLFFALLVAGLMAGAAQAAPLSVTSSDLKENATIAREQVYGRCGGGNVSPALAWSGAPAKTKSFAVTVFDPDARHRGWWHWVVFGIPPKANALPHGKVPAPAWQGLNDFGNNEYDGPCPPAGDTPHHYEFTVWALDTGATPPFGKNITGTAAKIWLTHHALAKGTLTARYGR